jgi:uncharacterized protein
MVTQQPSITPRKPPVSFAGTMPRYWFSGDRFLTHMINGVNLLFPAGERFFVRSVRHYTDGIEDPELRKQAKAFAGQESWHARAHERFFEVLKEQGYPIERFLRFYEAIAFGIIERLSTPALSLSVTAAAEHYTAIMAENALQYRLFERAHSDVRALLMWHAAEEIEHKSVAFDVLKLVNPSYPLRMAGFVLATLLLSGFWVVSMAMFYWDDLWNSAKIADQPPAKKIERETSVVKDVFFRGIREYLRRDFHPTDNDNLPLAKSYLAEAGIG